MVEVRARAVCLDPVTGLANPAESPRHRPARATYPRLWSALPTPKARRRCLSPWHGWAEVSFRDGSANVPCVVAHSPTPERDIHSFEVVTCLSSPAAGCLPLFQWVECTLCPR